MPLPRAMLRADRSAGMHWSTAGPWSTLSNVPQAVKNGMEMVAGHFSGLPDTSARDAPGWDAPHVRVVRMSIRDVRVRCTGQRSAISRSLAR